MRLFVGFSISLCRRARPHGCDCVTASSTCALSFCSCRDIDLPLPRHRRCSVFFKQRTADEVRISDWSSDVCSSDLPFNPYAVSKHAAFEATVNFREAYGDRKSVVSGKSVSVRVDLGGRRTIKKNRHRRRYTSCQMRDQPRYTVLERGN